MSERYDTDRLLEARDLEVGYGTIQVVWGVSLHLNRGEVVSMIGPNGAGKTTTFRALAGLIPVRRGRIVFNERDVTSEPAHERVRHRLCLVPEGRQLWPRMTVEENLLMGGFSPPLRGKAHQHLERIYQMFPRLAERRRQACGTLSGGEQQMCAIGRGLMAEPLLLLLDEPCLGLAPMLVEQVFEMIGRIAEGGVSILLAAQNANDALLVSHSTYVMETGKVVLEGLSEELRISDHVRRAYFGVAE
jgi:branched-chain amino acid transport system ATP-binding protein